MRAARFGFVLLLLAAQASRAGEVPDPLFWATEADFLQQVEEGQFVDRLELHLVQYGADSSWRFEWAARRYSGNGLFGEFGSTTGTELYLNSGIALNLFPSERIQVRYDRREYREGRFDVSDQRFDVAWHAGAVWAAGLRVTGASLERSQSEGTGEEMSVEKTWGRATVSFRRDLGRWSVSALAGWSSQRDETSSPSEPAGTYSLDAFLLVVEGGVRATRNLRLRLGYLGSSQQAERTASEDGPLPARQDDAWLDKAHVRALYEFRPQMAIELLLSHALRGGSFGGGSIKAILVF